ncbi:hypothetical protein [Corallibacter sp.]|uniref:hypothetical protein n=1 Tax=Corallibacter sp. TaxID=2038084 RepID=UPI003A93DE76
MGKMALGYGSEFHLLRWLGRHRNEFNKRIKILLDIDNVTWIDFDFDAGKEIPDKELIGLSFLQDEPNYQEVLSLWKKEWPQTGNSMNWDLVGYTIKNGIKTWILIEAKAHLGELSQSCGASKHSLSKIEDALLKTAENNGINIIKDNPWTKKYYQFANRIYIQDFLNRSGIKSKLINIYFLGDMSSKNRKSPKNKEKWEIEIDKMKRYLNIEKSDMKDIKNLYLEIDK